MIGVTKQPLKNVNEDIECKMSSLTLRHAHAHYFQDANYFTPLVSVPPQKLAQGVYFSITFDTRKTANVNSVSESIYLRNGCQYYKLIKLGSNSFLLKKQNSREVISPEGIYQYIITSENNATDVRVGRMPHLYLNDKRFNHIIVAGDIIFKKVNGTSAIVEINDQSGGYHVKNFDEDIFKLKLASIRGAIEAIGIPMDKFKCYSKPVSVEAENRAPSYITLKRSLSFP